MTHDPHCPLLGDAKDGSEACLCDLISVVRADERKSTAMSIAQALRDRDLLERAKSVSRVNVEPAP